MDENFIPNSFQLQVDSGNTPYLAEAAKWAKFLAIIGFVICGMTLLTAVLTSSFLPSLAQVDDDLPPMGTTESIGAAIVFIIVAILYFIPSLYLFRFASKMQTAIRTNDQISLNDSFKNLKSCLKFWGIFFIILLCFYALFIVFLVAGSAFIGS